MNPREAIAKLEEITGIPRPEMRDLWEKVKANQALLKSCTLHDFSIEHRKQGAFVRDWRCSRCGGHVESAYKRWYELGLEHGRGNPIPKES